MNLPTTGSALLLYTPLITSALSVVVLGYQTAILRRQHKIMAHQAEIAQRAMTRADEPYIVVKEHEVVQPTCPHSAAWPPLASYTLEFHGRTPARLRAVYDGLLFCDAPPPPAEIVLDGAFPNSIQRDGSVRENYAQMALASAQNMEEELVERASTTKSYFLIAKVVFDDIFGHQHEFGFCYNAPTRGGMGNPHGGAAYNYRRIRSPNERI